MKPVFAGKLDRRVTLQVASLANDSFGQVVSTWSDLAVVWAEVVPYSGAEGADADERSAVQMVIFRIRFRLGVEPKKNRIVYDGRVYDIEDVREDPEAGRRELLRITAKGREVKAGSS